MTLSDNVYWLEQTEAEVLPGEAWLSPPELISLRMLRFPKRRSDWRLGRWAAKNAVALCLGIPTEITALRAIEIRASSSGAPEVFLEDQPAPVAISLSHRAGLGACLVGQTSAAVGCDLEFIESHGDAFAADYFSTDEQSLLAIAPKETREALVTLLWSAKESALKVLRQGLRLDTRSVVVTPGVAPLSDTPDWHSLQVRFVGGESFCGWWNQSGGFIRTTLAVPPPGPPVILAKQPALTHE
jgi:4'-phosphopantetheinyl transferase